VNFLTGCIISFLSTLYLSIHLSISLPLCLLVSQAHIKYLFSSHCIIPPTHSSICLSVRPSACLSVVSEFNVQRTTSWQDGGCTCPGDVAKAIGAGADFVMLGGMMAGHDQVR
jgi:IMP dehydrogenase / GMP reductase domain